MIQSILADTVQSWRGHKCRRAIAILALFGVSLIGLGAFESHAPLLVWNASGSAPIGLYRVLPGATIRGDLVLVHTPDSVRELADERRYLPADVPLIKRIVGAGGDIVCAAGDAIFIDGRHVADRLVSDGLGRPLPRWSGCHLLDTDEVFLLMADVSDSFDSRYFGPITTTAVIGRLIPVWVE